VNKYLDQYAEPGTAAAADIPDAYHWHKVIVIPVCNESTGILRTLPPARDRSLMILVVNETGKAQSHVSAANLAFAQEVMSRFELQWQSTSSGGLSLLKDPNSPRDVLLVDRFNPALRFPDKGGVGHARKTGADLAAFLIENGQVRSPWIHCSDADVVLPPRYLTCTEAIKKEDEKTAAALIYPFRHEFPADSASEKVARATRLYEFSLRYYVAGLKYAGSPYAFHTIGSTITINAEHYGKVRGFPRRQAGEDFYLLNKLAKVGSIRQLSEATECGPIEIAARLSDRVPFGTGAAVTRMVEMNDPAREFLLYHPAVFESLKNWLDSLPCFWQRKTDDLSGVLMGLGLQNLVQPLREAGAPEALHHALQHSSDEMQFYRQMHTWFDAFRTLKLIHFLRDQYFPSMTFESMDKDQSIDHLLPYEPVLPSLKPLLSNVL